MLDLHAWFVIPSVQICTLGGLVSKSVKPKCAFFQITHGWVLRPTRPCKNARPTLTSAKYLMRSTRPCILEKYARSGFTTNPTVHSAPLGSGPKGAFRWSYSVSAHLESVFVSGPFQDVANAASSFGGGKRHAGSKGRQGRVWSGLGSWVEGRERT